MRVINCFTDPRIGGPGTRSIAVGRGLQERGIDVHFLIPHGSDSLADAAAGTGFEVHRVSIPRIRSPRKVTENLRFLAQFRRTTRNILSIFQSVGPDIIHVNTPYNFQTARAAYLSEEAAVWHFNDTLTPWPINRIAGRLAPRWADEIVVSADAVRNHFFTSDVGTRTLYPPVDLDKFDLDAYPNAPQELRAEFGLEDADPIVGTIGNVNPAKGHRYLLEAVPDVLKEFPDAKFLIVGSKLDSQQHYFEELQEMAARRKIRDAVHFAGWRSDIPELFSLFDLFVLPSVTEACPVVVLEAMAMRCPVVATNVGGVREQIPSDEYGWVVPPEDSVALAKGIRESLFSESRWDEIVWNSREIVEETFSLDTCVDRYINIYNSVVQVGKN